MAHPLWKVIWSSHGCIAGAWRSSSPSRFNELHFSAIKDSHQNNESIQLYYPPQNLSCRDSSLKACWGWEETGLVPLDLRCTGSSCLCWCKNCIPSSWPPHLYTVSRNWQPVVQVDALLTSKLSTLGLLIVHVFPDFSLFKAISWKESSPHCESF